MIEASHCRRFRASVQLDSAGQPDRRVGPLQVQEALQAPQPQAGDPLGLQQMRQGLQGAPYHLQ